MDKGAEAEVALVEAVNNLGLERVPSAGQAVGSAQDPAPHFYSRHGFPEQPLAMLSSTDADVYHALIMFRDAVTGDPAPIIIIQSVIDAGAVPRFVELLKRDSLALQFEATGVLTNIAAGTHEQTRAVIRHGALPVLVQLFQSPSSAVYEQALWAVGNIAYYSRGRDEALWTGALETLLGLLTHHHTHLDMASIGTRVLANLCCRWPGEQVRLPPEQQLRALRVLAPLVIGYADETVLGEACRALDYLTRTSEENVKTVASAGMLPRLVKLLGHPSVAVHAAALRVVRNLLVLGDDHDREAHRHAVVNLKAVPRFMWLLGSRDRSVREQACRAVAEITAGTQEQIQAVIEASMVPSLTRLVHPAERAGEGSIRNQAARALSNAVVGGTWWQVAYLVEQGGAVPLLRGMLDSCGAHTVDGVKSLAALQRISELCPRHSDQAPAGRCPGAADSMIADLTTAASRMDLVDKDGDLTVLAPGAGGPMTHHGPGAAAGGTAMPWRPNLGHVDVLALGERQEEEEGEEGGEGRGGGGRGRAASGGQFSNVEFSSWAQHHQRGQTLAGKGLCGHCGPTATRSLSAP